MNRRIRTNPERPATRAICPAPTLLAVLLLVTVVPGAAAYAVLERDVALRTTLRDTTRRDDARELSIRVVSELAGAMARTVERQAPALPSAESRVVSIERGAAPVAIPDDVTPPVAGHTRLALLNLPPPLI